MAVVPESHLSLLTQPNIGHLATLRPDGRIQLNDMWFAFDGARVSFTHTRNRQKFRNVLQNPAMTLSVTDPDNGSRYVELQGHLAEVIEDPSGSCYTRLSTRYGSSSVAPPLDAADRVILVMAIDRVNVR